MPTVSTAAELGAAIKAASLGSAPATIHVAPGARLTGLLIRPMVAAGPPVSVVSADPLRPGIIAGSATFNGAQNLTIRDLEWDLATGTFAVYFNGGRNIEIDRCNIHGPRGETLAGVPGGLSFLGASNVRVTRNEFSFLRQAVGLGVDAQGNPISDIDVIDNHIHDFRKTGIVVAGASRLRINGNVIERPRPVDPVAEHPDYIQYFTNGTKVAASDIEISDNLLSRGGGGAAQGIFGGSQNVLRISDVRIRRNMLVGTGWGAIAWGSTDGLVIEDNRLVTTGPLNTEETRLHLMTSTAVRMRRNSAVRYGFDRVTDLEREGDETTAAVADGGISEVVGWARRRMAPALPAHAWPDLRPAMGEVLDQATVARKARAKNAEIDKVIATATAALAA